jgi:hypothetical protein
MTKDFYKYTLYSLILGLVAYSTGQGTLQEKIEFAGVANEIAFFLVSTAMFLFTLGIAISELIKSVKTPKSINHEV